jgi:hypothetical protein
MDGKIVGPLLIDANGSKKRVIHGELRENKVLLHADPDYVKRLRDAARNESELRAWIYGDWDITAGGMFDDVWDKKVHVIPNIPHHLIPKLWRIDRAYGDGSAKPFSVGWWAESNGEPLILDGRAFGVVPGDLIRLDEWYGWTGKENVGLRMLAQDIGRGIIEREDRWRLRGRVLVGPADRSIFDPYEADKTIAGDMRRAGVLWDEADKSAGSRIQGWDQIRKHMRNAALLPREEPGLFVTERCEQFRRTVPTLTRSSKNLDDADTESEDHVADETRYRVRAKRRQIKTGGF